ncbi:formamidopyrimidine-DNA glycosylase [Xylariomycetidae sp. FL2044]|nr:formamidopyrimidine-DNA glycosylase [Xylariomycetidae sp. FL2044]
MPEIAEVARVTHFLRQHLVGKTISKILALDDSNVFGKVGTSGPAFQKALAGKTVVGAGSQGKYFWLVLDTPPHPVMHLGMTGWVHIRGEQTAYTRYAERAKGEDKEQWPPKYWRFHLETASSSNISSSSSRSGSGDDPKVEVAFTDARRFGRVRLVDCPGDEIRKYSPLVENGPDPVVDRDVFTEDYLRRKMRGRHVPIKALLLDQAMISGIGNWVGDEIMYQARLHPEQYSDDFDDADVAALYRAVCYVCDTAVAKLADSDQFPKDWLFNHRWGKGKKDAATTLPTGEKITFLTVGGRTSCVVPSVQRKRGRTAIDAKDDPIPSGGDPGEGTKTSPFFAGEKEKKDGRRPAKRTRKNKRPSEEEEEEVEKEDEDEEEAKSIPGKGKPTTKARNNGRTKKKIKQEEEKEEEEEDDEGKNESTAAPIKATARGGRKKGERSRKEIPAPAPAPATPKPEPEPQSGRRRSGRLKRGAS